MGSINRRLYKVPFFSGELLKIECEMIYIENFFLFDEFGVELALGLQRALLTDKLFSIPQTCSDGLELEDFFCFSGIIDDAGVSE